MKYQNMMYLVLSVLHISCIQTSQGDASDRNDRIEYKDKSFKDSLIVFVPYQTLVLNNSTVENVIFLGMRHKLGQVILKGTSRIGGRVVNGQVVCDEKYK